MIQLSSRASAFAEGKEVDEEYYAQNVRQSAISNKFKNQMLIEISNCEANPPDSSNYPSKTNQPAKPTNFLTMNYTFRSRERGYTIDSFRNLQQPIRRLPVEEPPEQRHLPALPPAANAAPPVGSKPETSTNNRSIQSPAPPHRDRKSDRGRELPLRSSSSPKGKIVVEIGRSRGFRPHHYRERREERIIRDRLLLVFFRPFFFVVFYCFEDGRSCSSSLGGERGFVPVARRQGKRPSFALG